MLRRACVRLENRVAANRGWGSNNFGLPFRAWLALRQWIFAGILLR
jgi:hypothetical protein